VGASSWHRVDPADVPAEGRVRSVAVDGRTVALARCGAGLGALENRCPHQGGPLGEGSIENGWLRCPWHGYDYDPLTGRPPEGFSDGAAAYELDEHADGVYVRLPAPAPRVRTVADVLVETLVAFGITHVFGMVGHSNLGFADAMRRAEERGQLTFTGIRHEGAASFAASAYGKLTGRPGGSPTNGAGACPPPRSSTRCRGTCHTTRSSPSMSATTPTRWAGTWNPAASRS
jgi:pyruvate oxidase